ncbi:MAG: T9SS type A sorting domain-containing protein, partial [bacterium]|nr:T9SS type A sorting domain-containing protein [bacterium]
VTELKNSKFERTVTLNIKPWLVRVDKHGDYRRFKNPTSPLYSVFRVKDCEFRENITGIGTPLELGLEVTRSGVVRIDNSSFFDLRTGALMENNLQVYVTGCTFERSTNAFLSLGVSGRICTSTFTANEFSVTSSGQPTVELYDNVFSGTRIGDRVWGGGRHWLRNNTFTTYAKGVAMRGTVAYMRNRVIGGNQDHEFGYNTFYANSNTHTFGTYYSPEVHDISLTLGGQVFVDCGYNDFDIYSTYHVFSEAAYNVNATNNRWTNAGPVYMPRVSPLVTYTGAPLDVQADRVNNCGPVVVTHICEPPITYCGPRDDPQSLTAPTSGLYTTIGLLRTDALNTSIDAACRRSIVWEYFENVRHTDSTALYAQLKSDMATIVANTSEPSYLRSAALHVKAKTYDDLKQLDSARTAYTSIMTSYSTSADSVPANWAVLYLNAIEDTTGHTDSLRGVHMDRIIFDLRRTIANGGMAKETANDDRAATTTDGSLAFISVVPNPARDECRLSFDSKKSGPATIEIISSDGAVVKRFATTFTRGMNVLTESLASYSAGLYFVRCNMDGMSVALPVTVSP